MSTVAVDLDVETWATRVDAGGQGLVQRVFLTINTNNQVISPTLRLDGADISLPFAITATREVVEYTINRVGRIMSMRLAGSALTDLVEVFSVEVEVRSLGGVE